MRIRTGSAFVSSVLFTIALVCLVPMIWANVITDHDRIWLTRLDSGDRLAAQRMSDLSVVCLAIVLIGLIVLWTGYVKRTRASWAVMFVVVWVWAFPLLVLPLFTKGGLSIREWLYTAIYYPGSARSWAQSAFLLMVIALLLPARSFFLDAKVPRPIHTRSPKLIGGFAAVTLLIVVALLAWIRLSPYEISPTQLFSYQQLPPPPPPPNPCWSQCGAK